MPWWFWLVISLQVTTVVILGFAVTVMIGTERIQRIQRQSTNHHD